MRVTHTISPITFAGSASGSLATSISSDPIPVSEATLVYVQAVVSAAVSLNGTLKLQASADEGSMRAAGLSAVDGVTNWTDITGSSQTITDNGVNGWNLADVGYRWIRLVWTSVAGTGTVAVRASMKGF